jgi:hypothetical protein
MPLVHDFMPLDRRFETVTASVLTGGRAAIAARLAGRGVDEVSIGTPRFRDEDLVIPLRLGGVDLPFERLEADLVLMRVDGTRVHLALTGSYRSPALSRRDAITRQRLTESWVRTFLTSVVAGLVDETSAAGVT